MSIMRIVLFLILVSGLLIGCVGLQKSDWLICVVVGGVIGVGLGVIESSSWVGWGVLIGGGVGVVYCWVYGVGEQVVLLFLQLVEEVVLLFFVVKEEIIVVCDLYFVFDLLKVDVVDSEKFNGIVECLKGEVVSMCLSIIGYIDSVGFDVYNQKLLEWCVNVVVNYLIDVGVFLSIIVGVQGLGESQLVVDNKICEGWVENCWVEIFIKCE